MTRFSKFSLMLAGGVFLTLLSGVDASGRGGKRTSSKAQEFERILSELPAEAIDRPDGDVCVNYILDSLYYDEEFVGCEIRLPIVIGGKEENAILDNGCARFCFARESFAVSHGIRPIGFDGNCVGVAGTSSAWFGICDSLVLGELRFRNLVFTVVPDSLVVNPVLDVNVILGSNVFSLAGEMRFDNVSRTLTFPYAQQERLQNVLLDRGGLHFVDAVVEGRTLKFQLDLGAARTTLSANYYKKNKARIRARWSAKESHLGGLGGIKETEVYYIDELPITACGGTFVKKNAEVSTVFNPIEKDEFGSIGNDFLLSFDRAVLNLKTMYLYVE